MHDTQKTVILNGMSELGPELPPEVYRRRRIVAVVVLILVLLVGIVGITTLVNQINKGPQDDAAAEATATGEPFQNFSARPTHLRLRLRGRWAVQHPAARTHRQPRPFLGLPQYPAVQLRLGRRAHPQRQPWLCVMPRL